jgi:deoxyribodipyrimidine photo-lyase
VRGGEVIPLFVLDDHFFRPQAARRTPFRIQFLLESVASLAANLQHAGSRLIVVAGRSVDVIPQLARRWKADRVLAQGWVAPVGRERDRRVAARLHVPLELFAGETLCRPGSLRTGSGAPFSVFSAFARAFRREVEVSAPLPVPRRLPALPDDVRTPGIELPALAALGLAHREIGHVVARDAGERVRFVG